MKGIQGYYFSKQNISVKLSSKSPEILIRINQSRQKKVTN